MLNSIKITKFRAITDTLELKDLTRVNYLIGENGSGKSSVIDLLARRVNHAIEQWPEQFLLDGMNICEPNGTTTPEVNTYEACYLSNSPTTPGVSNTTRMFNPVSDFNSVFEQLKGGYREEILKTNYIQINKLRESLGLSKWEATSPGVFTLLGIQLTQKNSLEVAENSHVITSEKVASGLQQLMGHRQSLINAIYHPHPDGAKYQPRTGQSLLVILIEEPEMHMHPKYQKLLPELYSDIYSFIPENPCKNVQLFVTTHSPFIISAAGDMKDQRVYILENGTVRKSEGYSPDEARGVAASMLGAQVSDFAPEKVVFVDGESTKVFLENVNKRFYNQSINFIVSLSSNKTCIGGDDAVTKLHYTLEFYSDITSKTTLLFPKSKIYFVIDSPNTMQTRIKNKIDKTKDAVEKSGGKLAHKFIISEHQSLEEGYPYGFTKTTNKIDDAKSVGNTINKSQFELTYAKFKKIFD